MLTLLRIAYPNFYRQMKAEDGVLTLGLWSEAFCDDDVNVVKFALKELIATHTGFPPDIAAVKERIRAMQSAVSGDPSDEQLWQILKRAAENGYYGAREEFDALPPVLQSYCGSPSALRDMAMIPAETLNTVTRGQFLKQIRIHRERDDFGRRLPEAARAALMAAGGVDRFRLPGETEAPLRTETPAAYG